MSEREHFHIHSEKADTNDHAEQEEVDAVLAVLQTLARQTRHPVVRACLEQTHDDIIHLTTGGDQPLDDDDESAAA